MCSSVGCPTGYCAQIIREIYVASVHTSNLRLNFHTCDHKLEILASNSFVYSSRLLLHGPLSGWTQLPCDSQATGSYGNLSDETPSGYATATMTVPAYRQDISFWLDHWRNSQDSIHTCHSMLTATPRPRWHNCKVQKWRTSVCDVRTLYVLPSHLVSVAGTLVVCSVTHKQPKNIISLGVTLNVIKAVCIPFCYHQAVRNVLLCTQNSQKHIPTRLFLLKI